MWHRLNAYQDTIPGLTELKPHAKNQGVPWDAIFSSELFGSYKPNKKVYQSILRPHKTAMVAAASVGFKTVCIPRPAEDPREVRESMRSKTGRR
ncbi:hypothetical protein BDR07DRAFT_373733 [Suillus spraguei]|nr:hypothetical protein BDR07DRAFT_373733 [Suillus spraguei]